MAEKVKPAAETAQRRIDESVVSPDDIKEIPATLQVTLPDPKTCGHIAVTVTVDPSQLRFLKKSGRSMQELTLMMVLQSADGEYLAGKQAVMGSGAHPAQTGEHASHGD